MATKVTDSILTSTKIALGIIPEYTVFDDQLIMLINSEFSTLYQLGVGPEDGFEIEDEEAIWKDYLDGNKLLNLVIKFVHMSVRLAFDPPQNSFAVDECRKKLDELTWRINVMVDPEVLGG